MSATPTVKTTADLFDLNTQIGGIIVNPTDGDNDYAYLILSETDHGAGTTTYRLIDDAAQAEIYRRNVPSTSDWKAQAMADMEEEAQRLNPGATIYLHEDDSE